MTDAKNGGGEASSSKVADQPVADSTCNEDDAQGSASNHVNTAEDVAQSKPISKASSTRTSTPRAASLEARQSAQNSHDASSAMEDVQQSQETATASSKHAQPSANDSEENDAATSSYGTRSRNRPGRSRPNYAEDTEMDFEMAPAATNGNVSDPPSRNSVAPDSGHSSSVSGKKGSAAAQGNASWGNSGSNPKDNPANPNIPGASASAPGTQSSTPQPTTKRRKNAAATTTNGNHASAAAPSQAGPKRGNHAVGANSARESNMLTFEKTGAFLKDGHLEADDGQTVSVNGKF